MRYHDDLIGNTFLPAIHGGTLGAMLEMAAIFHLLWETETETVPKIVNITVTVSGLKPGMHGVHLHAVGKCTPDFAAAGGHLGRREIGVVGQHGHA